MAQVAQWVLPSQPPRLQPLVDAPRLRSSGKRGPDIKKGLDETLLLLLWPARAEAQRKTPLLQMPGPLKSLAAPQGVCPGLLVLAL